MGNPKPIRITKYDNNFYALLIEIRRLLEPALIDETISQQCQLLVDEAILLIETAPSAARQHDRDRLTERELEVAAAITAGLSNSGIAERLFISVNTVRFHIGNILRKLEAKNRSEAAAIVSVWAWTPARE
ncbi:helix-turn-helix transcriptional regulator [Rhodococcus koreensis]|uniref:helix-turn-helix domain-containing protein n=1 Tax=Rhodococcus koreensis TaxID=99653 RepID=UPI00366DAA3F